MLDSQVAMNLPAYVRVLMTNGQVEEMKLETYLAGAVAAQIGTSAPLEALKAQAVASRTYVVAARRHPEHNADVCVTTHCQKWKRVDPVSAPEVFRAVGETWGLVTMSEGALIHAFFFEHCDGHTRNSEAMLLPTYSYLRGVDCACGFLTLKGHGVGMCMRGAIVMARRGASFEQILQHYYRGVQVVRIISQDQPAPELEQIQPPHVTKPVRKKSAVPKTGEPASKRKIERESRVKPASSLPPANLPSKPIAPIEPAREEKLPPLAPVATPPSIVSEPSLEFESEPVLETPVAQATPPSQVEPEATPAHAVAEHELPALEENIVPEKRMYHIDHLPGTRMIAGCLDRAGLPVMIVDPHGQQILVFTGNATHYGAGGFETIVDEDGVYRVTLDGQIIEVTIAGETAFIHAG